MHTYTHTWHTNIRAHHVQMSNKLLYRSKQRGFLELDLLMGLWAEENIPHMDMPTMEEFSLVLDQVRLSSCRMQYCLVFLYAGATNKSKELVEQLVFGYRTVKAVCLHLQAAFDHVVRGTQCICLLLV